MQPVDAQLPRLVRAVVFDMDGLIFNTEDIYRDAVMAIAAEARHDVPLPFYLSTVGLLTRAAKRLAFIERFGEGFDFDSFWSAASNRFAETVKSQLRLKAGVVELLDLLDLLGLPRAICTSSRHEDVRNNLAIGGLVGRFQFVIAQGDYVGSKPHPAPFLKAAERLSVAPESCVALEDSYHGVRSASGAGMMTIMVPDLFPPTDDMKELCVCIAQDLHEVCTLIAAQPRG
jgi:HAD superfamily hydrolase (TIGR01509 family)